MLNALWNKRDIRSETFWLPEAGSQYRLGWVTALLQLNLDFVTIEI